MTFTSIGVVGKLHLILLDPEIKFNMQNIIM